MSVAGDYRAIAQRFRALPARLNRVGADELKRSVESQVRADTGNGRLSGIRYRKQPPTLTVTVTTAGDTATVAAGPPAAGYVWKWIEHGTSSRQMGKLHMRVGGQWRTGPWSAAGTRPKRTFTAGVDRGRPTADRRIETEWSKAF